MDIMRSIIATDILIRRMEQTRFIPIPREVQIQQTEQMRFILILQAIILQETDILPM